MKLINLLPFLAAVALLTSCGHRDHDAQAEGSGHEHEEVVSFNSKSGLLVPPETAKFIGLQIVDVQERKVTSRRRFMAQVYRSAFEQHTTAHASAMLGKLESASLREGQAAQFLADGQVPLTGRIVAINREMEQASGTAEVQVEIEDAGRTLTTGSHVAVTVTTGKEQNVVAVPRAALLQTAEGNFIYTVSGERFVRAAVKVGALNDEFVEITDGLYAGDQVASQPVMTLWLVELQSLRGGKACADGH